MASGLGAGAGAFIMAIACAIGAWTIVSQENSTVLPNIPLRLQAFDITYEYDEHKYYATP
jgi:hypothetical protein